MKIARKDIIAVLDMLSNETGDTFTLDKGRYLLTGTRRKNGWDIRFKDVRVDNRKELTSGRRTKTR